MATLKDAEKARAESAEQLRQLGAHAISVEEGDPDDEPEVTTKAASKASSKGAAAKASSFVVVAYFDEDPPESMPNRLEVRVGKGSREVPLKARRSDKFKFEPGLENVPAQESWQANVPEALLESTGEAEPSAERTGKRRRGSLSREPPPPPAATLEALAAAGTPELVGRNCNRKPYKKLRAVPPISTKGPFIAYASPDSTYAVTRRMLDAATKSILIGIYDLTARYMESLLVAAIGRGVKVTLSLDLDGRSGETSLFKRLAKAGVDCVPAPSCASAASRFFASSHEKVIVIDGEWTLVQSGNWSTNSIPRNEIDGGTEATWVHGNRDMGLAVRSRKLAAFFTTVLEKDIALERNGPQAAGDGMAALAAVEAVQEAPERPPLRTWASQTFSPDQPVDVQPILSPENYMALIPGLIAGASRYVYVEQQYIRGAQPQIKLLLDTIAAARTANPGLVVRIVVAPPFPGERFEKEAGAIRALGASHGLALGREVRILNPRYLAHCHNKLVVVDDRRVLISSQNWSDSAVTINREAGLLVDAAPIARYFRTIFNLDWQTGRKQLVAHPEAVFAPEAVGAPGTLPLEWGDYVEV